MFRPPLGGSDFGSRGKGSPPGKTSENPQSTCRTLRRRLMEPFLADFLGEPLKGLCPSDVDCLQLYILHLRGTRSFLASVPFGRSPFQELLYFCECFPLFLSVISFLFFFLFFSFLSFSFSLSLYPSLSLSLSSKLPENAKGVGPKP